MHLLSRTFFTVLAALNLACCPVLVTADITPSTESRDLSKMRACHKAFDDRSVPARSVNSICNGAYNYYFKRGKAAQKVRPTSLLGEDEFCRDAYYAGASLALSYITYDREGFNGAAASSRPAVVKMLTLASSSPPCADEPNTRKAAGNMLRALQALQ